MQYEDWEYHPSRLPPHAPEIDEKIDKLEAAFLSSLREDPRAIEYLKPYHPKWADKFLVDYAAAKAQAVRYSQYHVGEATDRELRYRKQTEEAYEAILQKKLFNIQCLWRAEQITIPEIRCTWDFDHWDASILQCPFVAPATEDEIALMRRYLDSHDNPFDWPYDWQNYDELMEKSDDGLRDSMPEWYEYYDTYMGTGYLLDLPDLRSDKEEVYMDLWRKENRRIFEEQQAINPTPPYVPPPPSIHCGMEERHRFAQVVDDEIFQQIFFSQIEDHQERRDAQADDDGEDAEEIILMHLSKVKNPPPVRGGVSWQEAVRQCWYDYLKGVIAEDIDLVWEEHRFYQETGLTTEHTKHSKDWKAMSDDFASHILRGRELAGEPLDFNF